jgi:hypothetical protein
LALSYMMTTLPTTWLPDPVVFTVVVMAVYPVN